MKAKAIIPLTFLIGYCVTRVTSNDPDNPEKKGAALNAPSFNLSCDKRVDITQVYRVLWIRECGEEILQYITASDTTLYHSSIEESRYSINKADLGLILHNVEGSDEGLYQCIATTHGVHSEQYFYNVETFDVSFHENEMDIAELNHTLTLSWQQPVGEFTTVEISACVINQSESCSVYDVTGLNSVNITGMSAETHTFEVQIYHVDLLVARYAFRTAEESTESNATEEPVESNEKRVSSSSRAESTIIMTVVFTGIGIVASAVNK